MSPSPDRKRAEKGGRRAETIAALWLGLKRYRIVGRRVRTPLGEIDLVALSPDGLVCIVEVKTRASEALALEAITLRQRERILRSAELFIGKRPALRHKGVRFDAILIAPGRLPRHVKDAWRPW
jgi:putative endonuclease